MEQALTSDLPRLRPVARVAIAARDEAAMRLIHAVREQNDQEGARTETVALFADADARALFVREADLAVALGPHRDLERALVEARADAVWAGWGAALDLAAVAELCARLGVTFVGPPAALLRRLADAGEARALAAEAGLATGDVPPGARRIEVDFLGDEHGHVWAAGVREATVRRGAHAVLVEAPAPSLSPEQDREARAAAERLARHLGYRGAGAVELAWDAGSGGAGRFVFAAIHPSLSRAHAVTEAVSGLDLVKLSLHVARGGRLEGEPPPPRGHAALVRLEAEDPDAGFAPAPGRIELLRLPTGPGLRIDRGVTEGDVVLAGVDPLIAAFIAWGHDRGEALARARRALTEAALAIRGGSSNKAFLLGLLARPEVRAGVVDATFVDGLVARDEHVSHEHAEVALLCAAVEAHAEEEAATRAQFYASAARGRPILRGEERRAVELRHRGRDYRIDVQKLGPQAYRVDAGGGATRVSVERLRPFEQRLTYAGRSHRVLSVAEDAGYLVEVEGVPHRIARAEGGVVHAPTPAMVLAVAVKPGDEVEEGARLVTLEAMKMEMAVTAPFAGRVREVLVTANVQVDAGAPLVRLEPVHVGARAPRAAEAASPLRFAPPPPLADDSPRARWARAHEDVRRLLLGFDIDAAEAKRAAAEWAQRAAELPPEDAEQLGRVEEGVLALFADVHAILAAGAAGGGDEDRSPREHLHAYLRAPDLRGRGLPSAFLGKLARALAHHDVTSLDRSPALEDALLRLTRAQERGDAQAAAVASVLERRLARLTPSESEGGEAGERLRRLLDHLIAVAQGRFFTVHDLGRELRYRVFEQPVYERARDEVYARMNACLARLAEGAAGDARAEPLEALVDCPQPLVRLLIERFEPAAPAVRALMIEVLTRRYYRTRRLDDVEHLAHLACGAVVTRYEHEGRRVHAFATYALFGRVGEALGALGDSFAAVPADEDIVLDVYAWSAEPLGDPDATARAVQAALGALSLARPLRRIVVIAGSVGSGRGISHVQYFTFRPATVGGDAYEEQDLYRGVHPMMGKRMHMWRLENFALERLPSVEDVFLFHGRGRDNPRDERFFAVAEVRDLTPVRDSSGRIAALPYLERMLLEALGSIRLAQARRPPHERLQYNRVLLYTWQPLGLSPRELVAIVRRLAPATEGLGIEQVLVHVRIHDPATRALREQVLRIIATVGKGLRITMGDPATAPMRPMTEYDLKVSQLRRRGLVYPYEIVKLFTPPAGRAHGDFPPGDFVEHDLDAEGRLVPVDRPWGKNTANVVAGVIKSFTPLYPEGMTRVILLGDPSKETGSVAEPECRRIIAALDLAERLRAPVEWFTLSAGAKISMRSGTENMDWVAAALRRIIEHTQAGFEINVIVCGINVGAQPYWNAEATMLMHTRGILVMIPEGAMVLTGKQALDYSGSVSAEDNLGIGGYDRIMGPNGQAQYRADDIGEACRVLLRHYDHAYVAPGERFPRRASTTDPGERDVRASAHPDGDDFATIGEVFSDEKNPGRKKPFDVRAVMGAVVDSDHRPLERWKDARDAETAVVWDARLGGHAVCLIGIESRPVRRLGFLPADGPDRWTAGTLFPRSSKKVARAINAAGGARPVVVLANLSGFDGSPDSMRNLQLEYGAEIGRAIVNFRGPIVFCVISRYHGGAFVVFSRKLNERLEAAALEGTYASVIGGAPAAAVVFAREVDTRTAADPRVSALAEELARAAGDEKRRLASRLADLRPLVRSEKLGEVAEAFDRVHSVQRAREVGSLDLILPPARLRPYLIDALDRGVARALAEAGGGPPARR